MNTIIIHQNTRLRGPTLLHKLNAALISPVPVWYRKPTPWWVDGFEEKGLRSIPEVDEELVAFAEEDSDVEEVELIEVQITIAANIEFELSDEPALEGEDWSIIDAEDVSLAGEDYVFVDVSLDDKDTSNADVTTSFEIINNDEWDGWDEGLTPTVIVVEVDVNGEEDDY